MSGLDYRLVLLYRQTQRIISQCSSHIPGSCGGPQMLVSMNSLVELILGADIIIDAGGLWLLCLIGLKVHGIKYMSSLDSIIACFCDGYYLFLIRRRVNKIWDMLLNIFPGSK